MLDWPDNKGAESLVRMPDGRFAIIAESLDDGIHQGLLFSGDPVERGSNIGGFSYRPPEGYRVTDATMLPDGRMLVLNRSVGFPSGFAAKVAIVEAGAFRTGAKVSGKMIATLAAPLMIDNMEGIAVTQEDRNIIIWLISDNNFNIWQRTLLMKFRLSERE